MGSLLRKKRISALEERMVQDSQSAKLSAADREALKAELEELKMKESTREQRRLTFEDGEGVLAEDERGLGYAMNDRDFFGSDDDVANASGGEGNFNRELNRRPRKRQKTGKSQGSKVRLPQNDSLAEKMRRRNIEFELRYGSHRHTTKALESLSREQEELLQLVVACALYPNIALPGENNSERCAAECVFHTQQVPFVNLHPSSVIYPQLPTALSREEGLAFGSILQTHMPFLTHVTRCPVVPVVLLCAVRVDMAEDCRMLICDQWLQLTFVDTEELLCLIEDALLLRFSIQSALDREVLDLFEVDCDDDVPCDADLESQTRRAPARLRRAVQGLPGKQLKGYDLTRRALTFWHRKAEFSWQTLMPNEYAAFRGSDTTEAPLAAGAGSWLHFGSISEESVKPESSLVSDHLTVAYSCPICHRSFRLNRHGIAEHRRECEGSAEAPPERGWLCETCGERLPASASALDILRHRRSHGL